MRTILFTLMSLCFLTAASIAIAQSPDVYNRDTPMGPMTCMPYSEFKEIISETKLEKFNQYNLTFKHKNLSKKEISELKSLAYFKFYFNLKKIVQILKYFFKSKYEKTT